MSPQGIAVIGGGMTGAVAALSLADRGQEVTLFDKAPALMTRASLANEGKVHLGYVYVADRSFRTAKRMVDDALLFRQILERWISSAEFETCIVDPFDYVIPATSTLPVELITAHFARVTSYLEERQDALGVRYLGVRHAEATPARLPESDPSILRLSSVERGVWPAGLARLLSAAVHAHPGITVRTRTTVDRVMPDPRGWRIVTGAQMEGPFACVLNTAWAGRMQIDAASGFPPPDIWYTRFKFGVLLNNACQHFNGRVPANQTGVVGRFGDSVRYPADDSVYMNWYPVGLCRSAKHLETDYSWPPVPDMAEFLRQTVSGMASLDPAFLGLDVERAVVDARALGDFIIARGETDIADPKSGLHQRFALGPERLAPGYISVETGKYTSAPRVAIDSVELALAEI